MLLFKLVSLVLFPNYEPQPAVGIPGFVPRLYWYKFSSLNDTLQKKKILLYINYPKAQFRFLVSIHITWLMLAFAIILFYNSSLFHCLGTWFLRETWKDQKIFGWFVDVQITGIKSSSPLAPREIMFHLGSHKVPLALGMPPKAGHSQEVGNTVWYLFAWGCV